MAVRPEVFADQAWPTASVQNLDDARNDLGICRVGAGRTQVKMAPAPSGQARIAAEDGNTAVRERGVEVLVVLAEGVDVMRAELNDVTERETGVEVSDEARARVGIGEVVPSARHETSGPPTEL